MGEALHSPALRTNGELASIKTSKNVSKRCSSTSGHKLLFLESLWPISSLHHGKMTMETAGHAASFLLKVAALEMVRRLSKARCPFVWSGLQALQVFCYPPFKWIQRWDPFRVLVKSVQVLSRPLLILSIATGFSNESIPDNVSSNVIENSNGPDSHAVPETHPELRPEQPTLNTRIGDEAPQSQSTTWLIQLYAELEKQGISLPQRLNEDELHRFYSAANGNFSCLLSSIKKTIRWRETYGILSEQELEIWSDFVFWHGYDVRHRPCLIVRLGLACVGLPSYDKPRFAQAVVSQVEYGVVHLVDEENPQITVLVDCQGLSSLGFPMQIMRSCSALLQDNFPNRLGCLFVVRLPPVVSVIAQTFIQVLKPVTQQKLKIEGETYQKLLSESLQTTPSFLDGSCSCMRCESLSYSNITQVEMLSEGEISEEMLHSDEEGQRSDDIITPIDGGSCQQVVRAAMVGVLILWVFISLIAGIYDPESSPFLPPLGEK